MRIVLFAEPLEKQQAGIHVYTREMIRALLKYDQSNEYILLRSKKDHFFPEAEQVVVPNIFKMMRNDPLRLMLNVPQVLRKLSPDWVVEPAQFGPIRVPAKSKKISICHDLTPLLFPEWHTRTSSMLQRMFLKNIYERTDWIIANSDNTKKDLIAMNEKLEPKIHRIYPGVSECYEQMSREDQSRENFFLHLGTLEPRKNILGIVQAFDLFKKKSGSDMKLVLVGAKGWKTAETLERIENSTFRADIDFKGFLKEEEVADHLMRCRAFVLNSSYEGFGFPLLEAMHFGAPCLVSKNSSLTEVGGAAVKYHTSTEELAEHMALADSLNGEMSVAAKKQASNFSWKNYAEKFVGLLSQDLPV